MSKTELAPVPKRRSYPKTLKAQIVAQCSQPGTSIAGVALSHGVNANLVHKWRREAGGGSPVMPSGQTFVPVTLPARAAEPQPIQLELHRGALCVKVNWPLASASACAAWLREILR